MNNFNDNQNNTLKETEVIKRAKRLKELFPEAFRVRKKDRLILFDDDCNYITYTRYKKRRNFGNPEEFVQAKSYLTLIHKYNYPPEHIDFFVSVTMGRAVKEADIIVYNDDEFLSPHIVIECKREEVSELEFKQAVDQAFGYAVAEGAKYVWITSSLKNEYYQVTTKKPKERIPAPDIPSYGTPGLAKYKYAKGGGEKEGQQLFELEKVTEDELTRRFKQAHQALWGGGELNPSEAFDELDKLIFCKISDEQKLRKNGEPYDFQIFSVGSGEQAQKKAENELLERIKSLYEEGRKKDPEVFKDDIRLSPEKTRTVVSYLEEVNLGETDLDSKGRAFETFMGSFFRGDFGQYFTPRNIVKFIVEVLPIKNDSLVLDTSCGSGGFLLHALDSVRKQADKWYPDQKPEHDKPEGRDHYRYWHEFAMNNLFGIEINEQISRTAKMNMIIHDDGHTNVVATDGLMSDEDIREKTKNNGFEYSRFDFIITNPPFGSSVRQTEKAYLHQYRLATKEVDWLNPRSKAATRPTQSTEILFIEQCYNFLNEGGYLAIVIPDGILTNSSLQYVRDNIEEMYRIVAVVSMPQEAFQHRESGVKSSMLFLKKNTEGISNFIRSKKLSLQDKVKKTNKFISKLDEFEKEKNVRLKKLKDQSPRISAANDKEKELFGKHKKEITDDIKQQIDELKEQLSEEFLLQWQKEQRQDDYDILMAIAKDIGYDATGKPTGKNELDTVRTELSRFIKAIEEGKA